LFLQSVIEGEISPQLTFFSDEAWFYLQGYINTQNNRYWSSQNPHLTHEVLLHPVKVGAWCAVSARRIVGPMFLTKQLNAKDIYRSFSGNSFHRYKKKKDCMAGFSKTQLLPTLHVYLRALSDAFGDRIASSCIWPARSPNLNPCDLFFWACLKDKVYNSHPQTEEEPPKKYS
jgi:hypothetical protein